MSCMIDLQLLWRCWLGGRKGIRPVKNWVVGCWRGYLGWGADLHMAQQMPLPLTISCSSKSRLILPSWFFPFWYLLTRVIPDKFQKSSKTIVCVCDSLVMRLWVSFQCLYCPLSSFRQHLSYDVCLEVRGEIIRTVLFCIVYWSCAHS